MATILIVDDDAGSRKYLAALLRSQGNIVVEAGSGLEGLEVLRAVRPDLLITDIFMPQMDGLEFIQRISGVMPAPALPVLFYSILISEDEAQTLLRRTGKPIVIGKPSRAEIILDTVQRALARSSGASRALIS